MAISNDAEYMGFDFFQTLMTYLNEDTDTPLGKGLGIPVTTSVFFYANQPYNFSYFDGLEAGSAPSAYAPRIIDYIRKGYIDTIHAYGDFDKHGGFTRAHAKNCFQALSDHNVRISIYTNHGGPENIQNVGTDAAYHQGDTVGSVAYHADLMAKYGIRYLWTDSMITYIDHTPQTLSIQWAKLIHHIKLFIKGIYPQKRRTLIHDVTLQDGQIFKGFMRFRSTGQNAPNLSSLKYQIDQIDWTSFYNNAYGVVLYQHLGVLHRIEGQCYPASIEAILENRDLYLSPFEKLKEEKKAGHLWLARLIDFLNYVGMIESVFVKSDDGKTFSIICDHDIDMPKIYFNGLTLYIDPGIMPSVQYKNLELPYRINGPDETGKYSITIHT